MHLAIEDTEEVQDTFWTPDTFCRVIASRFEDRLVVKTEGERCRRRFDAFLGL